MSAIGNSYGDIYETHLEWAKNSRLNQNKGAIPDGYMENIMPILQGKLWKKIAHLMIKYLKKSLKI